MHSFCISPKCWAVRRNSIKSRSRNSTRSEEKWVCRANIRQTSALSSTDRAKDCHACDGACSCGGSKDADVEKLVAEVTKKILAQMNKFKEAPLWLINEQEIQNIVRSVLKRNGDQLTGRSSCFQRSEAERNLQNRRMKRLRQQRQLRKRSSRCLWSSVRRSSPISVRKTLENAKMLSELAVEGDRAWAMWDIRLSKHQLVAEKTPGTGGLKYHRMVWRPWADAHRDGVPGGVIGAVCPSTNPTCTVICNSIGMVAAGNAVVFMPHPSA